MARDKEVVIPTLDQYKQTIRGWLKDAIPGNPQYLAFFDAYSENDLSQSRNSSIDSLSQLEDQGTELTKRDQKRINIGRESDLRIEEQRIASQQSRIEDRIQNIPGYRDSYYHFKEVFEDETDQAELEDFMLDQYNFLLSKLG